MITKLIRSSLAILIIIGAGAISTSIAAAADIDQKSLLNEYVKIQQALAHDTMDGVKESAGAIEKSAFSKEIKSTAGKVANAKNLKEARTSFKDLSKAISPLAKKNGGDFEVYSCPMANATWVQKKGSIANPYYGREMQTCGEKVN